MRPIDLFDRAAARSEEKLFLDDGNDILTFGHAREQSVVVARALQSLGIRRGHVVSIYSSNRARVMVLILAIWRLGAVWNPLNAKNALSANIALMRQAHTRLVLLDKGFHVHADTVRAELEDLPLISMDDQGGCDIGFDEFLARGGVEELEDWSDPFGNGDQHCIYIGTGGTTGRSKLVVITNRVWNVLQDTAERNIPGLKGARYLVTAPMTHAAGIMAAIYANCSASLHIRDGFDAAGVLDQIETDQITHTFLPPTAFYDLIDEQVQFPRNVSSLVDILLAASAISAERFAQGSKLFGGTVSQSFGQAEAPMLISYFPAEAVHQAALAGELAKLKSCGLPTEKVLVGILNESGNLLPTGEVGEIAVRGALVADGYFEELEKTAEAHSGGWLHTGDVGVLDADGYLYVKDRIKDMIISGGFNIYAAEVESVLFELSDVSQCAVVGQPDERWGEKVVAFVVARNGFRDEAAVINHAKKFLGSVKAPKAVHFVEELPMTAVGKINKVKIRADMVP